ncbi:hypothetical protein SAMN02910317_01240 [Ruminococcaceae bacterium FB2012]|nr:hypothetical protein SAMN02910317_01240 [Ruminococcaceae bacterium FB2012]
MDALEYYNSLYSENELKEKKAAAFDMIAKLFYCTNFGAASKSEIELLMFSILMDVIIEKNVDDKNVLDYNASSDYKVGKMLGIPQERVRSLKVKKQARYPVQFPWQRSLMAVKNSIVYDEGKDRIIIPMRDPNLYNEIRNYIEENGGYIEIRRGGNSIQIRPQYFFVLLYLGMEDENAKKNTREAFAKELKEKNKEFEMTEIKTDDDLTQAALKTGGDFLEFVDELLSDAADAVSHPLMFTIKGIRRIVKVIGKT